MTENAIVKNAASSKQVNKATEKERAIRDQELNDIAVLLNIREGRRFLTRIINKLCHYDTDDFNSSGSVTYYNLGERNIGRIIKSDCCEASISLYQLAEKENWNFLKQGE